MKHTMRAALAALGLCAAVALGSCQYLEGALGSASGPTSAPVANSIDGGGHLYVAAKPIALAYMKSSACAADCRHTINDVSHEIQKQLDAGLDAEARGDNAAVTLALNAFNAAYAKLWSYLTGAGQAVPSS